MNTEQREWVSRLLITGYFSVVFVFGIWMLPTPILIVVLISATTTIGFIMLDIWKTDGTTPKQLFDRIFRKPE